MTMTNMSTPIEHDDAQLSLEEEGALGVRATDWSKGRFRGWLEKWQRLEPDQKEKTKELVRSIIMLRTEVEKYVRYERKECLETLNSAGFHLASGGSGEIASALIESVQVKVDTEKEYIEFDRKQYFSSRAVLMLVIGIFVQGIILATLFGALSLLLPEGLPVTILGIKTLSLLAVVFSGIVGSLARVVYESQAGIADEKTLQTVLSMAATSFARPLLAAVLAIFVFALFQCGLIGIPFETTDDIELNAFAREDFFFAVIAFVVGFNDTLGLNLLAFVSKYLPQHESGLPEKTSANSKDK